MAHRDLSPLQYPTEAHHPHYKETKDEGEWPLRDRKQQQRREFASVELVEELLTKGLQAGFAGFGQAIETELKKLMTLNLHKMVKKQY